MTQTMTTAITFSTPSLQILRAVGQTVQMQFTIRRIVKTTRDILPLVPAIVFQLAVLSLLNAGEVVPVIKVLGWSYLTLMG